MASATSSASESATQRALRLPELLAIIFSHFGEMRDVCTAMRTNTTWAAAGIRRVWRRAPRAALQAVPAARCRVYDAAIRAVELPVSLKWRPKKAWRLPRLRELTCCFSALDDASRRYATALLQQHAERLQNVTLTGYRGRWRDFLDADVDDGDDLAHPALDGGFDAVLHAIVRCRRLVTLEVTVPMLSRRMMEGVLAQDADPFPLLRVACASVEAGAARTLCVMVRNVSRLLVIVTTRGPSEIIDAATKLARLEILGVGGLYQTCTADLERRGVFPRLMALFFHLCRVSLPDAQLSQLLRRVPNIVGLDLHSVRGLSDSSLALIGQHCRELRYLRLPRCLLESLLSATPAPAFPWLSKLDVGHVVEDGPLIR
jgi:hypothetical protein